MIKSTAPRKIWLDHDQIVSAIVFHLIDEKWFAKDEIPQELKNWIINQIPKNVKIPISRTRWETCQSGTRRMIWILVACGLDPYNIFKYASNAPAMHNRFKNIIDTLDN